jgi:hypothetical protein
LAIQFWELYCICNEKTKIVAKVWSEGEIRLSFRRAFSESMMQSWGELVSVVEQVNLKDGPDSLVWVWDRSGVYSSHLFYAIINYRGIKPVYIPAIWKVGVPPKFQLFLWLLSHNKLATMDNLKKRGLDKPEQCCFCSKKESTVHLFFECVVSKAIWSYVCEFLGLSIGEDYISVASKWLHENKFYTVNIISTVALRGIWLTRNDFNFHKQGWLDVKTILKRMLTLTMEWSISFKELNNVEMEKWSSFLVKLIQEPLMIAVA